MAAAREIKLRLIARSRKVILETECDTMTYPTLGARTTEGLLPQPIGRVLRRLDRYVRVASIVRGLGITARGDRRRDRARDGRRLLVGAAAGGAVGDLGCCPGCDGDRVRGVRALCHGQARTAFDLAAAVEHGHPMLEEQLTGAVDLLDQSVAASGSPSLIAAVAVRAAAQVGGIRDRPGDPLAGPG